MNGYKKTVVYCDGSGWTVIQRRFDGSENFYRDWASYKRGFGELQREFWLGNDAIHLLTAQAVYPSGSEARIYYGPFNGLSLSQVYSYSYSHFQVNSEKTKYTLHVTGDSHFQSSDKQEFSTYDRDNDGAPSHHCARDYQYAGWWINGSGDSCSSTKVNLNGPYDEYKNKTPVNSMNWAGSQHWRSYEIRVRRL